MNNLWNIYTSFQKELINKIESQEITARDSCFLIEKNDWEKLIYNKINSFNQNNNNNILNIQKKFLNLSKIFPLPLQF